MDAPTAVDLDPAVAPPMDGHSDLALPADVARDAAAIVDAALGAQPAGHAGLTEPQRALLDFERQWWRRGGAKDQAIRDTFGMTPTRYYQALNGVLELPAAMRYDAALVHRLLRLRTEATRGRRMLD
ncbi:MAG TPA: DUF3263 domain-containing protein [Jiangellales bacterium]|nr:DUF3263 domain-containing protein [Jiangellales bacterium]